MYLLHQEANRADTYKHLPLQMPDNADFIPIVDPRLISEIMASPAFHVEDGGSEYKAIADRTGHGFSNILTAFERIPLVKEGEAHRKRRDEMAAAIAARAKLIEPRLQKDLVPHLAGLLIEGSRLDLVEDVAVPTYAAVFSELLGIDADIVRRSPVSEIFDRLISLNRRKRLERKVEAALQDLRSAGLPNDVPPELAIAMTVLGREPLIGSLSTSLWFILSRQSGQPLDAIDFPLTFAATGVPVIDRLAAENTKVQDLPVARGTRVRLFLDATSQESAGSDAGLLFGKGRHLCLGKPLALIAWRVVTRVLKGSPLRVSPSGFAFRKGDFLFNYPEYAHVELSR